MTDAIRELHLPWSGVGEPVHQALTTDEAIRLGGLDWDVVKRRAYYENARGNPAVHEKRFAIVRSDTDRPIGAVAGRYTTWQNRDAFTFVQALVDGGEATFDTAGSTGGGKQVFLTMKLSHELLVAGRDAHDLYLLLRTSHDGSRAVQVVVTPIRRRCTNQDELILATARSRWSVQHLGTISGRLQEAQDTLKLTTLYAREFKETADRLSQVDVELELLERTLHAALPLDSTRDDKVAAIAQVWETSPLLRGIRGTGWGALQAVTEWTDHRRRARGPQARFRALTDGGAARLRNEVARRLLTLAP